MHGRTPELRPPAIALSRRQKSRVIVAVLLLFPVGCAPSSSPPSRSSATAAAPASPSANHARQPLPDNGDAGEIRVCLTDEPQTSLTVKVSSRVTIVAAEETRPLRTIAAGGSAEIRRSKAGWTVDGRTIKAASFELHPETSPGLWVNDHLYRGYLRIVPIGNQSFQVINLLPLEHYLAGVIDGEVPSHFPAEARKAQAVAARSFAVMQRQLADAADDFDLRASAERSQSYLGFQYRDARGRLLAGESDAARFAVAETRGLVCIRDGRPFRTYYSACCGGQTTRASLFFPESTLPSVHCGACDHCPRSHWTARLSAEELAAAVAAASRGKVPKEFRLTAAEVEGTSSRQSVPRIRLLGSGNQTVTASTAALRTALGGGKLLSAWFSVRRDGNDFLLEGTGHGHGVGLCQWGAAGLAQDGADFRTILARYYPGCEILPISSLKRATNDRPLK